ncbi:hypothetical protein L0244_10100 [bacterium]|nr:hypothetical protein [bacterium]MCI0613331.1 hypothetical protein [bacterium]
MLVVFLSAVLCFFALSLFLTWRTNKKLFIFLQTIARNFGIANLTRFTDFRRNWLTNGVTVDGDWHGTQVTLETSPIFSGTETLLKLQIPTSFHFRIRRARNFYNYDVIEFLTKISSRKFRYPKSSVEDFEIFSDDPSVPNHILNQSALRQRLERCIRSQYDELEIDGNWILMKTCIYKYSLFSRIDWKEIEERLVNMWFLATTISSVLPLIAKNDINLLKCPYCRGMLNEGLMIVRCNECHTMFHESCWSENGKCAIFRCYGSTSEPIEAKVNNHVL